MSVEKKIVCLGGGSLYFLGALPDLLLSPEIAGSEIVLYDLDSEKSERMAATGRRMAETIGSRFAVRSVDNPEEAVDGADFALFSIGGSGAEVTRSVHSSSYHAADIRIPSKYGIHQIVGDTCGPAGMMMALRSAPAYLSLCREMEKRSPNVVVLSHSNPMAVLCRIMHKYTSLSVMGICHGVQGGIAHAARLLGVPARELECLWIGTNHYYWFTRVRRGGRDVYPDLMKILREREAGEGERMSASLSRIYDRSIVYPEDDHVIEFYPFATQAPEGPERMPYGLSGRWKAFNEGAPSPGAAIPAQEERRNFYVQYQALLDRAEPPAKRSDSLVGEGIGEIIGAIATGRRHVCIANVANQGAIPNLPTTAEVEVEAVTDSCGVRPLSMGEAPLVLKGLLEKRFVWQELVADAAVKGDRQLALQALMTDEMAIWPEKAEAMLDELLAASKPLLPQFG